MISNVDTREIYLNSNENYHLNLVLDQEQEPDLKIEVK